MHRYIMKPLNGLHVDHINGDRLDNRKTNLRLVTQAQNNKNSGIKGGTNSSGYKGVHWDKSRMKWTVKITQNGRTLNLGRFDDVIEAAKRYNEKAIEIYGEYAKLNKIKEMVN